jgi:YgiT-type zinc finger domain-containing protein
MTCDHCGKSGARLRYLSRIYGKGKDRLLIDDIPAIDCPTCGESYLTAETMHELERIKLHRRSFAVKRPVPVAEFATPHVETG